MHLRKWVIFAIILNLPVLCFSTVTPSDVMTQVMYISQQVNSVTKVMGVTQDKCRHMEIKKASPREVYFQVILLEKKLKKLYLEITDSSYSISSLQTINTQQIKPEDVLLILKRCEQILDEIQLYIRANKDQFIVSTDKKYTPTEVYNKVLEINLLLNKTFETKILPADVYQITSQSIYIMGEILSKLHIAPIKALNEDFVNIKPEDVFNKQLEIQNEIHKIGDMSKEQMLETIKLECSLEITPETVQSMAYIIYSEIVNLAHKAGILTPITEGYYPQKKFPSDVLKRNEILLQQIKLYKQLLISKGNR